MLISKAELPQTHPRWWLLGCMLFCALAANRDAAAQTAAATPPPKQTLVTADLVLDPAVDYGTLVIAASNITIDGRGTVLNGGDAPPNLRRGTGITSQGQSNVVLKNVRAKHWETGLHVVDGENWTIENCDFSDNFHDPDFGWGENGRRGGIVLENVRKSTLRNNRANHVWDACVLVDCDQNTLAANDFSHTSNTCLKLWHACGNQFSQNVLSHGIRIKPNEVHARDSTCVLIESGSNDNRFFANDCTHGGDGIFIRVLNGWCSTGNRFEENDCSYANNNGFECWAPRNEFVRNKANHCSYGFWMGGSDQTRLEGNEANYNGLATGHHNSPHLPGDCHAGIVFMFGSSSHVVARGNRCIGNNGAGIALVGDLPSRGAKWRAYHWIIEGNALQENRWGVFAQYADWVVIASNNFSRNTERDVQSAEGVSRLVSADGQPGEAGMLPLAPPRLTLRGPQVARVGQAVKFLAAADRDSAADYAWDLGDAATSAQAEVEHTYTTPGFYRVGVNATFPTGTELAYRDLYVAAGEPELAAEAERWDFETENNLHCTFSVDKSNCVAGEGSVRAVVDPYHGAVARLLYPQSREAGWSLTSKTHLAFWFKAINPNMPGWQSNNPEITLYEAPNRKLRLVPKRDLLTDAQYSEARDGWRYFEIPLGPDAGWERLGDELLSIDYLTIGVDSWDAQPLQIWIDGLILR